jgi:hypothetical protein
LWSRRYTNCPTSIVSRVTVKSPSGVMIKFCCLAPLSFYVPHRYAVDATPSEVGASQVRLHEASRLSVTQRGSRLCFAPRGVGGSPLPGC